METHPAAWASRNQEPIWSECVAPTDRPSIQGWASEEQLLRDMDDAGIETAILLGWYWQNIENSKLQNRFYAELIKRHPTRLKAYASVQATAGKDALAEIDWALANGFIGIGEIHPQAQGFSLADPVWHQVMEHLDGKNCPINFHVTDPNSRSHPGKIETPLADYIKLAHVYPKQIFILAHLGARIPLRKDELELSEFPTNLYFDCAAIPLLYERSIIQEMVEAVGAEHILFGSDYPLRVFPKEQKLPEFTQSIQFVRESGLTEDELRCVLSTNAKRLFSA